LDNLVRFILNQRRSTVHNVHIVMDRGALTGGDGPLRGLAAREASTRMPTPRPLPKRRQLLLAVYAFLLSYGDAAPPLGPKTLTTQVASPRSGEYMYISERGRGVSGRADSDPKADRQELLSHIGLFTTQLNSLPDYMLQSFRGVLTIPTSDESL
jgi:hypothetical protein